MFRSKRSRVLLLTAAAALLATAGAAQMQPLDQGSVIAAVERLRPGQYLWLPELAPAGPMLVVVNVATQRLFAYRNGVPIAVSTVSTGKRGHRTPLGVFTILQKAKWHRSSKYSNAPMPFMQRLTWAGVAMHGGSLPGYPASHGCIRLPHSFAKLLYAQTGLGMTVVVVDQPQGENVAPAPQFAAATRNGPAEWHPERAPYGPVSILISGADRRMVVLRNGVEIGSAPVSFDGVIDRVQAYVLRSAERGRYDWRRIDLPGQSNAAATGGSGAAGAGRVQGSDPFRRALAGVVGPGTTMIVLPDSLGAGGYPGQRPSVQMAVLEEEPAVSDWLQDASVTSGR